jgi:Photosynthesis system II assembly factor YCF48
MEDVPKIVQARLATAPPSGHPDANLLSAFSEGALSVRERGEVLQHLSICQDCREITSLALPEQQAAIAVAAAVSMAPRAMVSASAPEPALRRGLNLRWGALAACAVIVAGIFLLTRHPRQQEVALIPPGVMTAANKARAQQSDEVVERAEQLRMESRSAANSDLRAPKREGAKTAGKIGEYARVSQPAESANTIGVGSGAGIALASPPPPPSAPISDQPKSAELQAAPAARAASTTLAKAESAAPATPQKHDTLQAEAKEKDKKVATAGAAFSVTAVNGMRDANLSVVSLRWTLSVGKLRRSSDAGETWENVPFDEDGQFRALSVMGPELWVGGAKGVLYHSSDSGTQWVHIIPTAADETLAEDIVRIEFSDPHHGKLVTSQSEWRTSNGGKSWQKK